MAANAFISYSHRDEKGLELLHKHLAMLRRDALVDVWFDRQIDAGGKVDAEIAGALNRSELFLALVSPDFLNSNYCYEREMEVALARAAEGKLRVVPIILEPCDWKSSPLSEFKAVPKDGKPVSTWQNENMAMLDVVTELRKILEGNRTAATQPPPAKSGSVFQGRAVKVRRDFDSIEKADFRDAAYAKIRSYFESSTAEVNGIGDPLKARFEDMSATAFTCTVVNRAQRHGEANITVHNQKNRSMGDITCSFSAHAEAGSANGIVNVEVDEYQLFLRLSMFSFGRGGEKKLTAEQVARLMWDDFMERAGVSYD